MGVGAVTAAWLSAAVAAPHMVRDVDGHSYRAIVIGSRPWLAENLRVTHTPAGRPLESFPPNGEARHVGVFGRLYSWAAARRACPSGWHLPTDAEWSELQARLGVNAGWSVLDPEYGPRTNAPPAPPVGFSARPAGYHNGQGFETLFGTHAVFWTATPEGAHLAWSRVIVAAKPSLRRAVQHTGYGLSVRCVADRP